MTISANPTALDYRIKGLFPDTATIDILFFAETLQWLLKSGQSTIESNACEPY